MPFSNLRNRRSNLTFDAESCSISAGFDPVTGHLCEIFINDRGKSGTELERRYYWAGVAASKILQGEPIPHDFDQWVRDEDLAKSEK